MNKSEARIIIAGSRNFNNYKLLDATLQNILKKISSAGTFDKVRIVSGMARGADQLGERFAHVNGLEIAQFPANWSELGKRAGYIRNAEMAKFAVEDGNKGILVAFWDGASKGTEHMISISKNLGIEVKIVNFVRK